MNVATFNENTGYHVILEYDPLENHLRKFSNEIHGKMYQSFEMDRSRLGIDLQETIEFQWIIAEVVCVSLDAMFIENELILCLKILNPINIHLRQIRLQNWDVTELEKLLAQYGHGHSQKYKKIPSLVNVIACKHELLAFKLHATTKWGYKTCRDLWGIIT